MHENRPLPMSILSFLKQFSLSEVGRHFHYNIEGVFANPHAAAAAACLDTEAAVSDTHWAASEALAEVQAKATRATSLVSLSLSSLL